MRVITFFSLCLFTVYSQSLFAQSESEVAIPPQRERVVFKFAKQHHAELATLLQQLKEMDAKKYDSAILELSKTFDRLERVRSRSQERYETDLDLWKIDSRVKLLVARSIGGMEDETRQQIKELLIKRNSIRLEQFTHERDRLELRLKRTQEQISELKDKGDSLAEQDMERLLKTVSRFSKNNPRSAAKNKTNISSVSTKANSKTTQNSNSKK